MPIYSKFKYIMLSCINRLWDKTRINRWRQYMFYIRLCRNWQSIIAGKRLGHPFNRFSFKKGQIIAFDGNNPPWGLITDIWIRKCYTKYYNYRKHPKVVVDIGANIGAFSLYANFCWPAAKIFAFEPGLEFETLQNNIKLSKTKNIAAFPFAVSNQNNKISFYLRPLGVSSLFSGGQISNKIGVKAITLERIIQKIAKQKVDFLKIDCEGGEFSILENTESIMSKSVGYVAMEYHESFGKLDNIKDVLAKAGFDVMISPNLRWKTGLLFAKNRIF